LGKILREANMIKKVFTFSAALILVTLFATIALAQEQTGSIRGIIVDQNGEPLPGATVTLKGPALMGTRTYVSTEAGDYRFPAVPPGRNYTMLVEMPGFQNAERAGIIVSVGMTITIDFQLMQEVQAEEITVTGTTPTIDIKNTKHSVIYSSDMITNIPLARDYNEIIHSIPGISENPDVGGREWGFGAHGENVKKSQVALDGVSITDPAMGTARVMVSFDIFEEFEVQLGSLPAEVGMTSGAYVNIVTKSGGNKFSGLASVQWYNDSLGKSVVSQEQANALGLEAPSGRKSYYDFSLSLGGPIMKDKIWFFINGRGLGFADGANSYEGAYDVTQDEWMAFGKLTFQINPRLKLTGMFSFRNWDRPFDFRTIFQSKYSGQYRDNSQDIVGQVQVNWIMSQNSFLDLRFLYQKQLDPRHIHPEVEFDDTYVDRFTNVTTGTTSLRSYDYNVPKTGIRLGLTQFLDNFLGASHEVKAGIEYEVAKTLIPWWRENPYTQFITYDGSIYGFKDINPIMGQFVAGLWGYEKGEWESNMNTKRYSAYLQDSFTIQDRLTINLGIRYDQSHGNYAGGTYTSSYTKDPVLTMLNPDYAQEATFRDVNDIMVWKDFSPRVGFVYDLFGDHTTALKASWAYYNDDLEMGRLLPLTPSGPFGKIIIARWLDFNRNEQLDVTDGYIVLRKPLSPEAYSQPDTLVDPNIKSPRTMEWMVGIEREIFTDFRFSITYIHKTYHNHIDNMEKLRGNDPDSGSWVPYTTTEPGADGIFGTSDDAEITVYGVKSGAPPSEFWYQNIPEAKRTYHGVDFVLHKRMSNNWQFLGSLTWSRLTGNTAEGFEDSVGHNVPFDTPNWFINRQGNLSWDRPLMIKLQSSVLLPGDFILSGYFQFFSGTPWGRTLEVQIPLNPAVYEVPGEFVSVMAESPGSNRRSSRNMLDARVEKVFRFGNSYRLGLFVDVLNILGDSYYSVIENAGGRVYANGTFQRWTNYGTVTSIQGIRVFKLSARFTF
jgi:outer membrane receptor protein involved in Fe transport